MSAERIERNHLESRRPYDMAAESQLADFLDSYLYEPLVAEGSFKSIKRINDIEMQFKGVDVEFSTDTSIFRIDEKAQLHYINKNLPTFAFELLYQKNGQIRTGWFLNNDLLTDYYLLIWPQATTCRVDSVTKDAFTKLDALMMSKKKLQDFLNWKGLNRKVLMGKANSLILDKEQGRTLTNQKGIYYYHSLQYAEAPVNLVVNRRYLLFLADAHYIITRDGFEYVPLEIF